jgi:hypothetical protein
MGVTRFVERVNHFENWRRFGAWRDASRKYKRDHVRERRDAFEAINGFRKKYTHCLMTLGVTYMSNPRNYSGRF